VRIEQQLTIAAPVERIWDFLMDIPAMSQCVPGVENVEQVGENAFTARVKQKIGPVAVTFDCQITILSVDKASYSSSAQVIGRDVKVLSGMKAVMSMNLAPRDDGVLFTVITDVDISGKIAQYGHGIVRQRANALLEAFGQCITTHVA
jgi:carbon monoxide dehydrogenase subunit G